MELSRNLDELSLSTSRPRESCFVATYSSPRDMVFTSEGTVPEEYCCLKCSNLLVDPILTGCCGKNVCTACIGVEKGEDCPLCDALSFSYVKDQRVVREINATIVFCKYREQGCDWLGNVHKTKAHLENRCIYTELKCTTCNSTVRRGEMPEHLEAKCYIQWSQCPHCYNHFPIDSKESHLLECDEFILLCPNGCDSKIKRCDIPAHSETCPNMLIECQFMGAGCTTTCVRKDELKHLKEKHVDHSLLVFHSLQQQIKKLNDELTTTKTELTSVKQEVKDGNDIIAKLGVQLTQLRMNHKEVTDLLQSELQYFLHQPHNSPMKNLSIECLRIQLAVLNDPSSVILSPSNSLVFRLPMYSFYKSHNSPWFTSPFIVNNGYQMCMAVYLNGDQEGLGTHISIHLHLMAGAMDKKLSWPLNFRDTVVVSLVNQSSSKSTGGGASGKGDSSPFLGRLKAKSDETSLYATQQTLRSVVHLLNRVNKPVGEIGLSFSYIALFYAQSNINQSVLVNDSLVFMLQLKCQNTMTRSK